MKIFTCSNCQNTVYFHNRNCVNCGYRLGFVPQLQELCAMEPVSEPFWKPVGGSASQRFCANAVTDVCNWTVGAEDPNDFCRACRYNRFVPNSLDNWRRISEAQRHLFYSFLKWNLPAQGRDTDPSGGLAFDFLEDEITADGHHKAAMTGHDEGLISIRAAEADDLTRETVRSQMNEHYRTLLGHFRHEIGHFIWNKMVRDGGLLEECRAVFGDDRIDYDTAIQNHYANGTPPNWQNQYISAYASMHPWEDFAESFAHCLHIIDALETAHCYGMALKAPHHENIAADVDFDPYTVLDFERLAETWIPLSVAINSIHASMGERPLYPFILSPRVKEKLAFVHKIITRQPVQRPFMQTPQMA
ncbi:zinc-binding metallopeptidase family protein [Asticcacaulis machinosus]|uniref:Zinc-binding metallopeptidase n=1 Tax=Asticcacaulis machinosus TaxID=2984211 RepID=A0ABT5HM88_9CAUL|nr:putative zinc-binding metallopeptidase [Asticcacaulis machinosus]MDC7677292.1 putative zinc-binding metallopeptidase [Asticcacaulis machinosus]